MIVYKSMSVRVMRAPLSAYRLVMKASRVFFSLYQPVTVCCTNHSSLPHAGCGPSTSSRCVSMLCVVGLKVLMCSSHWRRRLRVAPFFEPVMLSTSRMEQINSTTGAGTPHAAAGSHEKKVNSVPIPSYNFANESTLCALGSDLLQDLF